MTSIREDAAELLGELTELRRDLHREPEVGLTLPRTQEKVLRAIDGLGLEISTGEKLTSVTAVLRGASPGPTVLLRGDMDALPLQERTGAQYTSQTDGVMHACGHDLHTSLLTGAARLLAARRDTLRGNVIFMFQPGEEGFDGAGQMLEEGVLDAAAVKDKGTGGGKDHGERPSAAYAIHVTSGMLPPGVFASRPGPLMAACADVGVTVRGSGGHGATAHRANDPIPAACEMVNALQTMVTRKFDIFDPVVVTVGLFHAGTKNNIIPDTARFEATIRTFSAEAMARVKPAIHAVITGIAAAHGLEAEVAFEGLYPVTVNNEAAFAAVRDTVREKFGEERFITMPTPMAGAEDFSRIIDQVPGAMVFLGATPPDRNPLTAPFNHAPEAAFDDAVLPDGAALLAELAWGHVGG